MSNQMALIDFAEIFSPMFLNEAMKDKAAIFPKERFAEILQGIGPEDASSTASRYQSLYTPLVENLPEVLRGQKEFTYTLGGLGSERGLALRNAFAIHAGPLCVPAWNKGYYADTRGHFLAITGLRSIYNQSSTSYGMVTRKLEDYKDIDKQTYKLYKARALAINFALLNNAEALSVPVLYRSSGMKKLSHEIINAFAERGYRTKLIVIDRPIMDRLTSSNSRWTEQMQPFKTADQFEEIIYKQDEVMTDQIQMHLAFANEIDIYWQDTQDSAPVLTMSFKPQTGWEIYSSSRAESFMNARNLDDPRDIRSVESSCDLEYNSNRLFGGVKSFTP